MTTRTITAAARDLQSAANKLALMNRHHNRDVILAGIFKDQAKGLRASERLEAQRPALAAQEAEVARLRPELGAMLDRVAPAPASPPPLDLDLTEPTKKRKKKR